MRGSSSFTGSAPKKRAGCRPRASVGFVCAFLPASQYAPSKRRGRQRGRDASGKNHTLRTRFGGRLATRCRPRRASAIANRWAIILWHTARMPDDTPPLGERRYEPRPDTAAGFEFIMGQIVAVALVTLLIGAALYCLPAIVARRRAHPKTTTIFALTCCSVGRSSAGSPPWSGH